MSRRRVLLSPVLAVGLLLGACGLPRETGAVEPTALRPFVDCAEFTAHQRAATADAFRQREFLGVWDESEPTIASDARATVAGPPEEAGPAGGPGSSGAGGLDLPDLAKTDGRFVYAVPDGVFQVIDTAGGKPVARGHLGPFGISADETGRPMLLAGDRVLLLSRTNAATDDDLRITLTLINVRDPDRPRVVGSQRVGGRVVSMAASGGAVRLVFSTMPQFAAGQVPSARKRGDAETATEEAWLPRRQILDGKGNIVTSGPLYGCTDARRTPEPSGPNMLSVLTFDPTREDAFVAGRAFGIAASRGLAAFSESRLYLATTDLSDAAGSPRTRVHAFDTKGPDTPYVADGTLPDYIQGPGAMSARGTTLRAVTTSWAPWASDSDPAQNVHLNNVAILSEDAGRLTGASTPLDMERRHARVIRWFDDALAVGPRSVPPPYRPGDARGETHVFPDSRAGPLRLVDLSEAAPRNGGLLDLANDTAELRPLGAGRVVAVGEHDVTMSVLDLTDLTAPRLTDALSYRSGWLWSALALAWPERGLVIAPGQVMPGSACPKDVRCASAAKPPCRVVAGCRDGHKSHGLPGAVAARVGPDGRLTPVGWWVVGDYSDLVVRVGDHLLGVHNRGAALLDPTDLRVIAAADFPWWKR